MAKAEEAAKRGKSDVWNADKKQTSGGTRWLNSLTREELYFISATVGCGQLQQSGAYPTNEVSMKFTW